MTTKAEFLRMKIMSAPEPNTALMEFIKPVLGILKDYKFLWEYLEAQKIPYEIGKTMEAIESDERMLFSDYMRRPPE